MTDFAATTEQKLGLSDRWALIRADRSFHLLFRTICVGAVLSALAVLSLSVERQEAPRGDRVARLAKPRMPASPLMQLTQGDGESALDSDFSLEQAALTWSHRLGKETAEADAVGVMRFGPVKVHQSIVERVVQAATRTEMDPALLMAIADKESNFSTTARARTSSASGLFQFVEKTWLKALKNFGPRYGHEEEAKAIAGGEDAAAPSVTPQKRAEILKLRNDPYLSAALAAELLKKDGTRIAERIGRPLTAGETYLIHFLGPEDTERFMRALTDSPQASAAALLPKPARANKPIFYAQQGRKLKDKSVSEVHEAFESMMGSRTSRYEDVAQKLPAGVTAYTE